MADIYLEGTSPLITLENLNTVYADVRTRIDELGHIYHSKGTITWEDLMNLESAEQGDVYNLTSDDESEFPNEDIHNGSNASCIQTFTSKIDPNEWERYWTILVGVLDTASDNTHGVIKTGSNIKSDPNIVSGEITSGLKLASASTSLPNGETAEECQTYVSIPVATNDTYGVVTNQAQEIGGAKTFKSDVAIDGKLSLDNTEVQSINKLQASSIQLGNIIITANGSKLTFSAGS